MASVVTKSDADIQEAVLRELKWDTRVDETDVGVEVDRGTVTLTGTVDSWAKRIAAEEAAHRVAGVLDVANDIAVKLAGSGGRTDTDIAQAVRHALEWDVFVPEQTIRSTVSKGWVALDGTVHYWSQREDAERAVRNLAGVTGVTNRIAITPRAPIAGDVRAAIEAALERRAQREAKRIELDVRDGEVTVSGVVHTWDEKQAVVGAIKGTTGVRLVEDRLLVEPFTV